MFEIPARIQPATLSKQEIKAREKGAQVVRQLTKQLSLGGVVDEYLADQIMIFMALATSGTNPPVAIEGGTMDHQVMRVHVEEPELRLQLIWIWFERETTG